MENIISGRYFNGHYYVTFYATDIETFFEILIKDDKIISAHGVSSNNNQITAYANYEFNYTNIDTSKVVMSLDGFTKAN